MIQEEALSMLKTGVNVFLTGEPGSGKTHTINEYVAYLRKRGVEPSITASTGIAATHIGGMTIHSWSGIGIKTKLGKHDLNKIASSGYIARRVLAAKVFIIDEVSMLSPETLSMVDAVCREIKQSSEPFGGIQVVLVGDFFQLPPVVKLEVGNSSQTTLIKESTGRFAYDSPAWLRLNPIVCYLTEQYRQDDNDYFSMLSAIRHNVFNDDHLRCIETRKIKSQDGPKNAPKFFSRNVDVDRANNEILVKLPAESQIFIMSSQGLKLFVTALKKGCLSPETLELKAGAAVMFTKNNPKSGFVNGTLGVVEEFNKYSGYPIVKTRDERRIEVRPMDWTIEENGKVRARIIQLPLRLAWAITVHKSQGMTLDEAVMDLSDVFEFGQGYVALSRVRRFSSLHLIDWNERAFQVDPEVFAKDEDFRRASSDAETTFLKISLAESQKMQDNFIVACGGKNIPNRTSLGKIREKHPNAYRPWNKAQDEKLRELFAKGLTIAELTKTFGRKNGAIRSRLAKLGLFLMV